MALLGRQETTNPADIAGSVRFMVGFQDDLRGTADPLLIASEPVGLARFALHIRVSDLVLSTYK